MRYAKMKSHGTFACGDLECEEWSKATMRDAEMKRHITFACGNLRCEDVGTYTPSVPIIVGAGVFASPAREISRPLFPSCGKKSLCSGTTCREKIGRCVRCASAKHVQPAPSLIGTALMNVVHDGF